MNLRLFCASRLATAETTAVAGMENGLPVFPADAGGAQESDAEFFHKYLIFRSSCSISFTAASRPTRSKITSASSGSVPTDGEYQTSLPSLLGRVAPRRLAGGEALLHDPFRFAEQHRNVLDRVQSVADEKRHDDDVFRRAAICQQPLMSGSSSMKMAPTSA